MRITLLASIYGLRENWMWKDLFARMIALDPTIAKTNDTLGETSNLI
jgi:hypothetical protein